MFLLIEQSGAFPRVGSMPALASTGETSVTDVNVWQPSKLMAMSFPDNQMAARYHVHMPGSVPFTL
jgi:hypothetical protein